MATTDAGRYRSGMDVRWFQDFLTVAELGNFTRAAYERNTSQAAFSRRIQALESWLGTMLIDRSSFPTRLTAEGERFREHAAEILRQIIDAKINLSGEPVSRGDHVRIALPTPSPPADYPPGGHLGPASAH